VPTKAQVLQARKAINKVAAENRAKKRREKLVLDHMHIVDRITDQVARKMTHLDPEDLRQAGFVGLLQAADRYKPKNGVFAHYCYFRIRGQMIDEHKRSAYRDDVLFLNSIDEMQSGGNLNPDRDNLPKVVVIDRGPRPEEAAAKREQARLLALALQDLEEDERAVFLASLQGIALIKTAQAMGRPVSWAREKLANARLQLGARVQMWGLGLDKAA
jgi:RNA polymerase sigma factor (sigma-70 family)